MKMSEHYGFIGYLKQPLQVPNVDRPTMFMASDPMKNELDLVLLTPGTFLHAYKYILAFKPKQLKLFIPSFGPEFISDIFNLYMLLKDMIPTKCVFPDRIGHSEFDDGLIISDVYVNPYSTSISFRYEQNQHTDDVYDILVNTEDESNYFSMFMTKEIAKSLYDNININYINLPMTSTLYGGLNYNDVLNLDRKYKFKFRPTDFTSIDEMYRAFHREKPNNDNFEKSYN